MKLQFSVCSWVIWLCLLHRKWKMLSVGGNIEFKFYKSEYHSLFIVNNVVVRFPETIGKFASTKADDNIVANFAVNNILN